MFFINPISSNELISCRDSPKVVTMFAAIFLRHLLINWWVTADHNIRKSLLITIYLLLGYGGGLDHCKVKNDIKVCCQTKTEQVEEIVNAHVSSQLEKKV